MHGREKSGEERREAVETSFGVSEAAHTLAEKAGSHEQLQSLFPWLQTAAGFSSFGSGVAELRDGEYADGTLHVAGGARDVALGGASIAGAHAPGWLEGLGPVLDGASAINHFRKGEHADGLLDTGSAALGVVAPELAAPFKIGTATGKALDEGAAEHDLFGDHRKASTAAADTGDTVRRGLGVVGAPDEIASTAGGVATIGQSVINTADSAIDAIVVPPVLRDVLGQGRGDGEPAGIAGTGISLSMLGGIGTGLLGGKPAYTGPTEADLISRFVTTTQATHQALKARSGSPYAGMYDPD